MAALIVWDGCMPSAASVESRWDGWRAAHPDTVAAAYPFDDIMPCGFEDGSTLQGDYMPVCKWRGRAYGDGVGASYVLVDGVKVLEW
ncbi:MAG: hypothetical protein E7H98_07210 [Finegoldia magna]|nr:hypothetical protein [Finegoldia magna]